jgi:type IV pilus assembly protein PilY1
LSTSNLQDQSSTVAAVLDSGKKGWKIDLDTPAAGDLYQAERLITDPIGVPNGTVFFTTFRPTPDTCSFGGDSYIWAVKYDTGSAPPTAAMQGKALLQVSTGAFAEVSLSSAFGAKSGRRTTNAITGVPPKAQGLSLMTNPRPTKRILHIQER